MWGDAVVDDDGPGRLVIDLVRAQVRADDAVRRVEWDGATAPPVPLLSTRATATVKQCCSCQR